MANLPAVEREGSGSVAQWWLDRVTLQKLGARTVECWTRECAVSDVTAAVDLGSGPVVGSGRCCSALAWKWSQRACQGHGRCLSCSKVLLLTVPGWEGGVSEEAGGGGQGSLPYMLS